MPREHLSLLWDIAKHLHSFAFAITLNLNLKAFNVDIVKEMVEVEREKEINQY